MTTLRLCHLYPDEMNIYADRGNIAVFRQRLAWRGLALDITEARPGDHVTDDYHLYYLGGGQDADQIAVADDLAATKADALRSAADDGAAFLCVCGGYQLAGHGYSTVDGGRVPGIGLLDLETAAGRSRLIGDIIIEADLDGQRHPIVGYENHAGRTVLGPDVSPWGRVIHGHGNNGRDGFEGATRDRIIGTYLHGPLLPKNPRLADAILRWALRRAGHDAELAPLDDSLEAEAHKTASMRAGLKR